MRQVRPSTSRFQLGKLLLAAMRPGSNGETSGRVNSGKKISKPLIGGEDVGRKPAFQNCGLPCRHAPARLQDLLLQPLVLGVGSWRSALYSSNSP